MKIKFISLVSLLFISRGCDIYTTSLWIFQEDGLAHEMNPLAQIFGIGWNGLLLTNILIVGIIISLSYYFYYKYKPTYPFTIKPKNYKEFISLRYFGRPDTFYKVLFKMPKNKKLLMAHSGYLLIRIAIIMSFLAAFHNLCQYNSYDFYNEYRAIVRRPHYVLIGLILLAFVLISRKLFLKEFNDYQIRHL